MGSFSMGGKCRNCGKHGTCVHFDGGWVCDSCIGYYFTCPDCGRLFDTSDREHGDAGNGFCVECALNH